MAEQCPHELIRTVNRRWDCLRAILEEPQQKRELVTAVDRPRSTVDTIVRELEQTGLVTYEDGRWRTTIAGRCTAAVYADAIDSLSTIHEAGTLLEPLTPAADLSAAVLDGAESFEATDPVPDAVLTEFLDRVSAAEEIRGVAPRALSGYTNTVFERAVENGTALELILADSVFSQLSSLDPESIDEGLDHELFSLYHGPVPVEFGFWIGNSPDHTGIIVYADRGIHGLIINDSPAAVEWTTALYEEIHADTTLVRKETFAPHLS